MTTARKNRLNYHLTRFRLFSISKLLVGCCVMLVLGGLLFPTPASAQAAAMQDSTAPTASAPTMQVTIGFNGKYRIGYWTPIHVSLSTTNADFQGTLSVNILTSPPRSTTRQVSPWSFEEPITLPKHAKKQVTLDLPFYALNATLQGVIATLHTTKGKAIVSQTVITDSWNTIPTGYLFIGVLAGPGANLDPLNSMFLPGHAGLLTTSQLDATTLPTEEAVLENFDIIILDNFASNTLHPNQLLALQTWVNRGGTLIEVGGPDWKRTLGTLPASLVPVTLNGTRPVPAGTRLLLPNDPLQQNPDLQALSNPLPTPLIASTATLHPQAAFSSPETILSYGDTPLIVQARQGQGTICYLAIDPASTALTTWSGTYTLWRMLFAYVLGDQLLIPIPEESYPTGPGQLITRTGILTMLEPETLPGPAVLTIFLVVYALLLGPIRFLFLRRLKRPERWRWMLFISIIIIGSLLISELTIYQRNASIVDNSISLLQVNQDGSSAHATTYSGIFVPNAGDFQLQMPETSLAQPIANQYFMNNRALMRKKDIRASVVTETNKTDLKLQGLGTWSLQDTISEQDVRLPGSIVSHLSLRNNRLVGTIQNTLTTPLSDLYVLFPEHFVALGKLEPGELRQIDLPLSNVPLSSENTLAGYLAQNAGLPEGYFPYSLRQRPQTEFQRHMALLSALNGTGITFAPCRGPCNTRAITNRGTIYVTGGRVPNPGMNSDDPLLVPGAPATLIGWTEQPLTNQVTINGWQPIGRQESFLQMPLTLDLSDSRNFPSNIVLGRVVDIQSYDAELRLSGIYAMTSGSITFEMLAPTNSSQSLHTLSITEPDLWAHPFGPGPDAQVSHLQAAVYNWRIAAWENIVLQQDTFTTSSPASYIGPDGRVLLQITNKDVTLGNLYFAPPSLSMA